MTCRSDALSRAQLRLLVVFAAGLMIAISGLPAPAQERTPGLRRIAPETVPDYRGASEPVEERAVTMPGRERPFGSCDRSAPRVAWLRCLKATSEMTDQKVNETVAEVQQALDRKAGAAAGRKRYWSRALEQSQELWRGLRNHECQQLASAEPTLVPDVYEARLLCLLRSDLRRIEDLQARYEIER